jgi:hypothetical protein
MLYEIPTGHNGYLDILLELGEIGLAFYLAWLLSCTRKLYRGLARDYEWASFAICLLLMSLIYNATESALNTLTEYITAVVVFSSLVVTAESRSRSVLEIPVRSTRNAASLWWGNGSDLHSWRRDERESVSSKQ